MESTKVLTVVLILALFTGSVVYLLSRFTSTFKSFKNKDKSSSKTNKESKIPYYPEQEREVMLPLPKEKTVLDARPASKKKTAPKKNLVVKEKPATNRTKRKPSTGNKTTPKRK